MIGLRRRMVCGLGSVMSALLFLHASSARAQCTKDTDCKGERVCQSGNCLDLPQGPRQGWFAGPASGPASGPPASAGYGVPGNAAAPAIPTAQPSGILPAYVCQPVAGYIVPAGGYGVAGAGPAVDSTLAWPNNHDSAFVRLTAGLGYLHAGLEHEQTSYQSTNSSASGFSGTAITLGAAVGGSVARNLAVFGEVQGSFLSDPAIDNSSSQYYGSDNWSGNYGLVSIGPGVSYYFEQPNMYLSSTLAITRLFGKEIDSKAGLGVNLGLGKEWRTSTNWGIGIVAVMQLATADDKYRGTTHTYVPSLRFSATWN